MFTYMLRRSQMKFIHIIRTAKQKMEFSGNKTAPKGGYL